MKYFKCVFGYSLIISVITILFVLALIDGCINIIARCLKDIDGYLNVIGQFLYNQIDDDIENEQQK